MNRVITLIENNISIYEDMLKEGWDTQERIDGARDLLASCNIFIEALAISAMVLIRLMC